MFAELSGSRQAGFGSPSPMNWAEFAAYEEMTGTMLEPWEWRVLRLVDAAWLQAWAEAQPKPTPKPQR